ncbi:Glycosyl transferase family 90 [Fragilaria crotonensis]|nr:Glycosyl transferase family 90 [Fragilaria crotonensis]
MIPLLVHALMEVNPSRFQPGQPVFQLLFSDGDSFVSDCVTHGKCNVDEFAPLLLFGSAPVDPTELPTVKAFPHWFYLTCLYKYKIHGVNKCDWSEPIDRTIAWDDLVNQIMWRGTDFSFLSNYKQFQFKGARSIHLPSSTSKLENARILMEHWNDLSPRWRAVAMSVLAEAENEPWIDAKFVGSFGIHVHQNLSAHGVEVRASETTTPTEMSIYKYQIDLGGGGGTTWRGTLSKLGMPGVLLHHETLTKDWFFDDMKHWEHFIPVHWSLVDLREKFNWVQQNPAQAKRIAEAGSKLFDEFMEEPYMARLYNELFVEYLGKVVDAYVPSDLPWSKAKWEYRSRGFSLVLIASCNDYDCLTFTETMPDVRPHHLKATSF